MSYNSSTTIIKDLNNTVAYLREENTCLKDDIKKLTNNRIKENDKDIFNKYISQSKYNHNISIIEYINI